MRRSEIPYPLIPAGYLAKRVSREPDWLNGDQVIDVYSVSSCCTSKDFTDYVYFWKHNGYWLFDSPEKIEEVAREDAVDLAGTTLFYYEIYPQQFDGDEKKWKSFEPGPFGVNVVIPAEKRLEGFDVATFLCGNTAEHSPLSCNNLAASIRTNEHCLLESLEQAIEELEAGSFANSEPGPFRIFAVYTLPVSWPPSH